MCQHLLDFISNNGVNLLTLLVLVYTANIYRKILVSTITISQVQSAESTILKQIEFHYNLLKEINIDSNELNKYGINLRNGNTASGRDAIEFIYYILKNKYSNDIDFDRTTTEAEKIKFYFGELYDEFGNRFGNYYKNLYYLVKYVSELPNIKEFKKDYYFSLIKAQLSKFEILLLAYNCIWIQERPKPDGENFIDYAIKYHLLSALEKLELISSAHLDMFSAAM